MKDISVQSLRESLTYNSETGELTWKVRPVAHFAGERVAKIVNTRCAGQPAMKYVNHHGYYFSTIFGQKVAAHRVIWALVTGHWPEDEIDHINGDRADNRWVNLRDVARIENRRNQRTPRNNTTGRVGVTLNKASGRYQAYIRHKGKMRHLGLHETFEAAVAARVTAERKYGFHPNHGRIVEEAT